MLQNPPSDKHRYDRTISTVNSSSEPVGFKGVVETSFVDWPGRVCAVLFFGGCNFRCPFCHNHPLVLAPDTLETVGLAAVCGRLEKFRDWLGGICISGGEPTLNPALPAVLEKFKKDGWAIKLDTNGSRPNVLEELIKRNYLDMISMDVKAPFIEEKYNKCAGIKVNLDDIRASVSLIQQSGIAHEFRMTVLPRFHTESDIVSWSKMLRGSRLTLQNFNPRSTLDPSLGQESPFPLDTFEYFQKMIDR